MSAIVDRMIGGLFSDGFDYMDYKLTPVITESVEAKSKATIEVSKAQAKQVELTTMVDHYRQFAKAVQEIQEISDDLEIDKANLIKELAKKLGILQNN